MAQKEPVKPEAAEANAETPSKPKRKKKLIMLIVAVLLVGVGSGAGWLLLGGDAAQNAHAKAAAKPIFVTLEPFTVNLAGEGADHFLQVGIDLKVADKKAPDDIKLHMPEIRHGVFLLLSGKRVEDIATVDGKKKLSEEIRTQVNRPLGTKPEQGAVGVFFTSFIIQ